MKRFVLFFLFLICIATGYSQLGSGSQWTWVKGDKRMFHFPEIGTLNVYDIANVPGGREGATLWVDNNGTLWLFGGLGTYINTRSELNDLWKYDPATNRWACVRNPGTANYGTKGIPSVNNNPGARMETASWTDASGNFWLFGGRAGHRYNDLWKYNPQTNEWTWVSGDNAVNSSGVYGVQGVAAASNKPGARGGISGWIDGTGKFWIFGGYGNAEPGNVGYLNDLWKYDPTADQWTWMKGSSNVSQNGIYGVQGVADAANTPGGRLNYTGAMDPSGNIYLFGGSRTEQVTSFGSYFNDLWKYDPVTNQWTWLKGDQVTNSTEVRGSLGVPSALNKPGGRTKSIGWFDASGNFMFAEGGGHPQNGGNYVASFNDVWRYNTVTNEWAWIKGDNTYNTTGNYGIAGNFHENNRPGGRNNAAYVKDGTGKIWIYGGEGFCASFSLPGDRTWIGDLWQFDPTIDQWRFLKGDTLVARAPIFGTMGTGATLNDPGPRTMSTLWLDAAGKIWLFGGELWGFPQYMYNNQLWKFDPSTNNWTLVRGEVTGFQPGVYGTQGISHPLNTPGAKSNCGKWIDASGNLWLFGGNANPSFAVYGIRDDLWKYNPVTNEWTWIKGTNTMNQAGVYGPAGVAGASYQPGARINAVTWTDPSGNFWLYGGHGYGSSSASTGYLSDLWKFDPVTSQWTFVKGNTVINQLSSYGTQTIPNNLNKPGGRSGGMGWTDPSGNLWLFGGTGSGFTFITQQNDLWKHNPVTNQWAWFKGVNDDLNSVIKFGVYGTLGIPDAANTPGGRNYGATGADAFGNLYLFGGEGVGPAGSSFGFMNDVWKYNISTNTWTWIKGDNIRDQMGVYGTKGIPSPTNKPGGTKHAMSPGMDAAGNFWLVTGYGYWEKGYSSTRNDVWGLSTSISLPVTLLEFSGKLINNQSLLYWKTMNESNLDSYVVERSINGSNYTEIGVIQANNGTGINNYNFTDNALTANVQTYYYRLKQKNKDGGFDYSRVVLLKLQGKNELTIYPNPTNSDLNFTVNTDRADNVSFKIINSSGQLIKESMWRVSSGSNSLSIDLRQLPRGIYYLRAQGDLVNFNRSFVKQ